MERSPSEITVLQVEENEEVTSGLSSPKGPPEVRQVPAVAPPEFKRAQLFKSPKEFENIDNHVFKVSLYENGANHCRILINISTFFRQSWTIILHFAKGGRLKCAPFFVKKSYFFPLV